MTRTERESLVEQYLEGSMDFAQEENFFIQVALDDELRRTLKSYRIVEEAIRKEREAGTREHAAARYVVAGMLAAPPQPVEAEIAGGKSSPGSFLKKQFSRRIAAAGATVGLVVFGWMAIQQFSDNSQSPVGDVGTQAPAGSSAQIVRQPDAPNNGQNGAETGNATPQIQQIQQGTAQITASVEAPERNNGREGASRSTRQRTTDAAVHARREGGPESAQTSNARETAPPVTTPQLRILLDSTRQAPAQQNRIELPTAVEWEQRK